MPTQKPSFISCRLKPALRWQTFYRLGVRMSEELNVLDSKVGKNDRR